jgi:hypothetical protein
MIARSEEYLEYVRSQSCSVDGCNDGSVAHHVFPGGVGLKGSDFAAIPLCWDHHNELHNIGVKTFAKKHKLHYATVIVNTLIPYLDKMELGLGGE